MKQPGLGKKIAELRKAKGLTQEELVDKCNLSVRTLQRIESGEVTPRSYTTKIIFAALDYSPKSINRFNKVGFIVLNWLEQFYRYFIDLFNLKTNTMKKISILSIMLFAIIFGLSAIFTESKAQNYNQKSESKAFVKDSTSNITDGDKVFSYISCDGCFDENNEMIGRDVRIVINGVTINARLIKLNKKNGEFNVGSLKGTILQKKVTIICSLDDIKDGSIKYVADKVDTLGGKIILKGNAKLTYSQNETIEAAEIIITSN